MSRRFWYALVLTGLFACGQARPPAAPPAPEAQAGPLLSLVPPGPSPLVFARPKRLFANDAVRLLWSTLVSAESERAFVERTQVDPRALDELVLFELPNKGYVVLARGPFAPRDVIRRAAERFVVRDVAVDSPRFRREGMTGAARYAYAELDAHALLVAKNAPPRLVAAILARLDEPDLPRALGKGDAAELYRTFREDDCVLFAPRPLALEPGSGVALLLAEERALAAAVRPEAASLRVVVQIRGEFPPGAEQNFAQLALSISQAPLGQLLGLGEVRDGLVVKQTAWGVELGFGLPAQRLALGLRSLFVDDLRELMR